MMSKWYVYPVALHHALLVVQVEVSGFIRCVTPSKAPDELLNTLASAYRSPRMTRKQDVRQKTALGSLIIPAASRSTFAQARPVRLLRVWGLHDAEFPWLRQSTWERWRRDLACACGADYLIFFPIFIRNIGTTQKKEVRMLAVRVGGSRSRLTI